MGEMSYEFIMLATEASNGFERFVCVSEGGISYRRVSLYLCGEINGLSSCVERFKSMRPFEGLSDLGASFERSFERLHRFSMVCCDRVHARKRYHVFRRIGRVLKDLFSRADYARMTKTSALALREVQDVRFWYRLIDRIQDMIQFAFRWLRDLLLEDEIQRGYPLGAIPLGRYSAGFVERADTIDNVLVIRRSDGLRELFNMTSGAWRCVTPLLMSDHPEGHALLPDRPIALLARHDADGNATDGDLSSLKNFIHAVGRGRGGNGMYFLAPYTRTQTPAR